MTLRYRTAISSVTQQAISGAVLSPSYLRREIGWSDLLLIPIPKAVAVTLHENQS